MLPFNFNLMFYDIIVMGLTNFNNYNRKGIVTINNLYSCAKMFEFYQLMIYFD